MAQRGGCGVRGELRVAVQQPPGEVGGPEPFQVHRQERDVVEPVQSAQPVVELQAVEHPGTVVEAEDVTGQQVAVPVDDPPLGDAPVEQGRAPVEELQGALLDLVQQGGREHTEAPHLRETVRPPRADGVPGGLGVDLRAALRPAVQVREHPGEPVDDPGEVLARADHRGQPAFGRHPPHDHQRLRPLGLPGSVRPGRPVRPVRAGQVGDAEVDVRREPAVQFDLPTAHLAAPPHGREVDEPQVDRLLQLPGLVADEEHHPDVGLVHGRVRRRPPSHAGAPTRSPDARSSRGTARDGSAPGWWSRAASRGNHRVPGCPRRPAARPRCVRATRAVAGPSPAPGAR